MRRMVLHGGGKGSRFPVYTGPKGFGGKLFQGPKGCKGKASKASKGKSSLDTFTDDESEGEVVEDELGAFVFGLPSNLETWEV